MFQAVYMAGRSGYKGRPPSGGGLYDLVEIFNPFLYIYFFSFHMVVALFLKSSRR